MWCRGEGGGEGRGGEGRMWCRGERVVGRGVYGKCTDTGNRK